MSHKHQQKLRTSQEKKKILDELHKTDSDLRNIKNNLGKVSLTDGEVAIISKYRIKNVIPREIFCKNYGIHYSTLHSKEFLLSSNILKEKLTILGEYCEPYIRKNRNSRKAK